LLASWPSLVERLPHFVTLTKPRVMALALFTAFVGLMIAPTRLDPLPGLIAILAIAAGAGAAGALNMWYDADIDARMARTAQRPIPAGRVEPGEALAFGLVLSVASVAMLGLFAGWLAAGLLAFTIFFYAVLYTMGLKRWTAQNIVIGGAAGAFPPMIGWAAATGDVAPAAVALFALIFFWTPPHFWALALYRAGDYAKAGVPMLPVVAGAGATKRQMLLYTLVLWPCALAPCLLGVAGAVYAGAALALSAVFTAFAVKVWLDPTHRSAKQMFGFSILYLFLLFALLLIDRAPQGVPGVL